MAAAGGRARVQNGDPADVTRVARAGAAAISSPAGLARRIVKKWPDMTRAERAEVWAILEPLMPRVGKPTRGSDQGVVLGPSRV